MIAGKHNQTNTKSPKVSTLKEYPLACQHRPTLWLRRGFLTLIERIRYEGRNNNENLGKLSQW